MNRSVFLLLMPLWLWSVDWQTWEAGKAEAARQHKPMLLALVRDNCRYCHDMEKNVFDDADMSRWLSGCFIPVKVNLSQEASPLEVRIPMTPTFVLLDAEGAMTKVIPGSWNIEDFKALTSAACTKE